MMTSQKSRLAYRGWKNHKGFFHKFFTWNSKANHVLEKDIFGAISKHFQLVKSYPIDSQTRKNWLALEFSRFSLHFLSGP